MIYENNSVKDLKIAYIGGGSRGWAWTLMNDLAKTKDMAGTVYLYDIDYAAALDNEQIGRKFPGENWNYKAVKTAEEAMTGADFVIISILPGTFDEMESDVHAPEKYGIYQSVGDTAGPGGFMRALRTVPMMREIAANVRRYCPRAWVINYTNPMAVCIGALYREFPEIRAYGCCHEVFGTQVLLTHALEEIEGIPDVFRRRIAVNVVGVNHFTWFTSAHYQDKDMFDIYARFVDKFYETGYNKKGLGNWMNDSFATDAKVRMDLFKRFGYIAAAGDRHLAEFMDFEDYLSDCKKWKFGLTPVSWRKQDLEKRLARSKRLLSGEEEWQIKGTGEEGTLQMRALLGLDTMVTNINMPNRGQISNLPMGTVVECNAVFRNGSLTPVMAGEVPEPIYPLIARAARENEAVLDAAFSLDLGYACEKFATLNLIKSLTEAEKRELFATMCKNTERYLGMYRS
ncbi:MAG: alpha-glucosidase/alpha-galactosidase [Clostridia bacterium]|nr:alpha-glucosidase/alpha-galactosidase [Clostridia bacterium]